MFDSASRIGFGCASLGSRIDSRSGLRALSDAFDRGVNWFDLAPSYGNGQAEAIFSQFLEGRRSVAAYLYQVRNCGAPHGPGPVDARTGGADPHVSWSRPAKDHSTLSAGRYARPAFGRVDHNEPRAEPETVGHGLRR